MYNTISSFDANLARDPTNIVETKKQDGRMVGLLKSSSSFSCKLNYNCSILLPQEQFSDNCRDLFTICLQGRVCVDFYKPVKSVIISSKLEYINDKVMVMSPNKKSPDKLQHTLHT